MRLVAGAAFVYFVISAVALLRRWRALSLTGFPRGVIGFDLVLVALVLNAIVAPSVTAWQWALLAFVARPMMAFLLVLATLRSETD